MQFQFIIKDTSFVIRSFIPEQIFIKFKKSINFWIMQELTYLALNDFTNL